MFMGLLFLVVWLGLFIWRRDIRREMLIISVIFGFIGPFVELVFTIDWWSPNFLFGFSHAGFEDVLFGFVCVGIAAVVYEVFFNKRLKIHRVSDGGGFRRNFIFVFILFLALFLFFIFFFFFVFYSFYSSIFGGVIPIFIIWFLRRDLIVNSLASGLILVVITFFVYSVLEFLTPGWVFAFWHFSNVPKIIIFNVPVDDLVWYFLAGLFIGPLYEFWQESKLVDA